MPDARSANPTYALGDSPGTGLALLIALLLHGLVILGLGFTISRAAAPAPSLDVTLVRHHSDSAPADAEVLAQHDQQGSGDNSPLSQLETPQPAPLADPHPSTAGAPPQAISALPATQPILTVLLDGPTGSERPLDHDEFLVEPDTPLPIGDDIASLQARLQQTRQQYSRMPRVLRTTALSARAAAHAAYLAGWVERVETVGNLHYPPEARRQRLYGELQMAVILLPDGSIADIDILRSSGHPVLDQAARDTLARAAPFPPFPPEMADRWDHFEIIRTWQFIPGHRLNTQE